MNGTTNGHAPELHPSLQELQSAITIVNSFLTEERYAPMRPGLAVAALQEIIAKAKKLTGSLLADDVEFSGGISKNRFGSDLPKDF
jgi:hypothetical protein